MTQAQPRNIGKLAKNLKGVLPAVIRNDRSSVRFLPFVGSTLASRSGNLPSEHDFRQLALSPGLGSRPLLSGICAHPWLPAETAAVSGTTVPAFVERGFGDGSSARNADAVAGTTVPACLPPPGTGPEWRRILRQGRAHGVRRAVPGWKLPPGPGGRVLRRLTRGCAGVSGTSNRSRLHRCSARGTQPCARLRYAAPRHLPRRPGLSAFA